MKLTVLGCYGTFPGVDGACSGYLIQDEHTNILIDCGNGVMGRVQRYLRIEDIDAIILSHLHLDHISDIFIFKYAIETKTEKGQIIKRKKIMLPSTPAGIAGELYGNDIFEIVNIKEGAEVKTGCLNLSFSRMPHLIESYAVSVTNNEKKFVYSGDMGRNEKITELAAGADLFLCESTLLEESSDCRLDHHFAAGMAGRAAAACGVKKLLLTHFWYEEDRWKYVNEAKKYFKNTYTADEFSSYII